MPKLRNFVFGTPGGSGGGERPGLKGDPAGGRTNGAMACNAGDGGEGAPGPVEIVDGGQPGMASAWEMEAHKQCARAEMLEAARSFEAEQMFTYLKDMGASPKRSASVVEQMLVYCNSLVKERRAAEDDARLKAHKLGEAVAEVKFLRGDVKEALAEADALHRKYRDSKEKLEKADRRRDEAVAKVARQMSDAALAHQQDKQQAEAQLRAQLKVLEAEMHRLQGEHAAALQQLEARHAGALAALAAQHEADHKALHDAKEREIDEIIDAHEAEADILKDKVRELAAELISQTDDFRPATDQALRLKLLDLRNRVKNITVPNNLHLRAEPGAAGAVSDTAALHRLPADLDPTGFVARHGARDLQYVLRGLVWNVLIDAFFSAPFGFGFLGPDAQQCPGRQQLLDIHRAWSRLYEGQHHRYNADELAMYTRDHNANKLRSAVFQSFLPHVFPEKAAARQQQTGVAQETQQTLAQQTLPPPPGDARWPGQYQAFQPGGGAAAPPAFQPGVFAPPPPPRRPLGGAPDPGIAVWHRQHVDAVVASIRQLLNCITGYATRPGVLEAVPAIVNLAAELGIEFGVQRAQVCLVTPRRDDMVPAGPEYHDCLGGGDKDPGGRDMKVDLMVSPGIVRIGDGRGDLTTRKVLVSCEVIPYV